MFSTAQATEQLRSIFEQWTKAKAHGGDGSKFSFEITFACKPQLQGKKLKQAIDDFHFLAPGTTKNTKSKPPVSNEEPDISDVDDGSKRFEIRFKVYKLFDGVPFTGKVVGYDATHRLYQI